MGCRSIANDTKVPAQDGLPAYTLRLSDRARHVRLTISAREGLVVVVPGRARNRDVTPFLEQRRAWIERASAPLAKRRALFVAGSDALLPDEVAFPATAERWPVEYRHGTATGACVRVADGLLVVSGNVADPDECIRALQRWLQKAAKERLLPMLAEEARQTGSVYEAAAVRGQRSRWGSCSHRRSISLNRSLLFVSPELARSVVLHELAHLSHPDHSARFWSHLETLDPGARRHRAAMRSAWDAVPPWAEATP